MQYLADLNLSAIDPWIALGVVTATALTDALCVLYTSSVAQRHDLATANWGSLTYMLSGFAVISFTTHWFYVLFAALGAWIGSYASMKYLRWRTIRREEQSRAAAAHAEAHLEAHSRAPAALPTIPAEPRIAA